MNMVLKSMLLKNIPDNWSITSMPTPILSLGKRKDLDPDKFVEFCKICNKRWSSFLGGCCEIQS